MDSQQAHALGLATGRREMAERLLGELRKATASWRESESKTGLRATFLWALTERWCARVERLAALIEADLGQLRTNEQHALAQYQAAQARALPPERKAWWRR